MTCRAGKHYECDGCDWKFNCEERKNDLVKCLVDAVLKWEECDSVVREVGWDGTILVGDKYEKVDEEWDLRSGTMVTLAMKLKEIRI